MQCRYCKGRDFDNLSYDYYVCRDCGKINYISKVDKKRPGALNEIYFAIAAGAVVLIIAILILLFVTAAGKKGKIKTSEYRVETPAGI